MPEPALATWTIYVRPSDYPTRVVVRRFVIAPGVPHAMPDPVPWALCDDVAQARETIPEGLIVMPRQDDDDPVILETWM